MSQQPNNTPVILSVILGFLGCLGIGHLVRGDIGKGIVLLILGWVFLGLAIFTFGITAVGYIILWIWTIVDTRNKTE
jgi:TM2 domain-containing membrane protein YozV